jgi:hypothetical protein
MIPAGIEISALILLELETVDHDGAMGAFGCVGAYRRRVGVGVAADESQPFAVRRPGVVRHTARKLGDPLCLAAGTIEQPDLVNLVGIVSVGEERQVPAVGTPQRCMFARQMSWSERSLGTSGTETV